MLSENQSATAVYAMPGGTPPL